MPQMILIQSPLLQRFFLLRFISLILCLLLQARLIFTITYFLMFVKKIIYTSENKIGLTRSFLRSLILEYIISKAWASPNFVFS